jgi:hypothetical protein
MSQRDESEESSSPCRPDTESRCSPAISSPHGTLEHFLTTASLWLATKHNSPPDGGDELERSLTALGKKFSGSLSVRKVRPLTVGTLKGT